MKTKLIKIADIRAGMKIKSADANGNVVYKEVTAVMNTMVPNKDQVRVQFENGTVVHCSTNHPFMVFEDGQMIQCYPTELTSEHRVFTDTGFTRIVAIDVGQENSPEYIDITVEETHTFFTKEDPSQELVLTHNSQGGIRNASATMNMPIWHLQFDDFIVLKNNQGTEETRVRHLDYCVVLSAFFWRRFKRKENITFFDPNEVPDLYEAFYNDSELFEKLYVEYEKRKDLNTRTEPAEKVFAAILKERTDTGRYYILNIDNVANQGPYDASVHPIYQTNLCVSPDTMVDAIVDNVAMRIRIDELDEMFKNNRYIKVLSKNLDKDEMCYEKVTASAKTDTGRKLLKITDSTTGKSIKVTPNHKVWTKNRGWVEAGNLKSDDQLDII